MISGWGSATDKGIVRAVNEDAFLADPPLFLVADGMGGHKAGDVASWIAVESFADLAGLNAVSAQQVSASMTDANRAILDHVLDHPDVSRMGTTIAGLAVVEIAAAGNEHWMVFNVGDCRVYRLTNQGFEQLTVDHSEAEELVLEGLMTRDAARTYDRRHVVTRSLGTDPAPVLDSWVFPPIDGERFLICSDGLTRDLVDEQIADVLTADADPGTAAQALVAKALEAGGRDNITVIVVDGRPAERSSEVSEVTSRQ